MSTARLYFDDPLLLTFDARVVAHGEWQGRPTVLLDRSAFYPEAGGQLGDRGTLGDAVVTDVQADDAGAVHHLVTGERPAIGAAVRGAIERDRRRVHMALHTAQHALSAALIEAARAETVSARLGETACTIDVDRATLADSDVARAEALVNAVIDDDVPIRAFFPSPGELAALPLRRRPKVSENIRVVEIAGFDVSPCGGTHCTRSAQMGLVRVTGLERYKGKMRVSFAAGRRAREDLGAQSTALMALSRELTCGPDAVGGAIAKLRRDLTDAREALGNARAQLAESAARELLAAADVRGEDRVVATFDGADVEYLRGVAARVSAAGERVAFVAAAGPEGQAVVVARGPVSTFDCGAFLKRAAAACGGRGGGRADRAEGRIPAGVDWRALVAQHAG